MRLVLLGHTFGNPALSPCLTQVLIRKVLYGSLCHCSPSSQEKSRWETRENQRAASSAYLYQFSIYPKSKECRCATLLLFL